MEKAIFGRKLGMTQIFDETGLMIPVTVIAAGPMTVVRKKTVERDGYCALQVAFEEIREDKLNKPEAGAFKKANAAPKRVLRELRLNDCEKFAVGSDIKCDIFANGDVVDVSGVSKGHGFSGVIKRWNQRRLKMTHGTGPVHRSHGSLGEINSAKVVKGMHMPGRFGHDGVTIQNLKIVRVDTERNVLLVRGAVPGPKGGLLTVKTAVKSK
ncbi:MAG: 50S ribosomal protein L3 [Clostridiales bacterium]|jgi:large subunit ribosomal protein L3|nr:50S ribosomal protein L3 [Clostridiales bacterium]